MLTLEYYDLLKRKIANHEYSKNTKKEIKVLFAKREIVIKNVPENHTSVMNTIKKTDCWLENNQQSVERKKWGRT
ncbi:MAG: hypothetical protein WCG34_01320 [Leptolinea sp.]